MMRIALLGATTVWGPLARVEARELGGAKPRQVLQMLALSLGTAVPKERLADRLWDGRPPASYIATLESYVCLLRRKLACAGVDRTALVTTGGGYRLDPEQVSVDVVDVRRRLLSVSGPDEPTQALAQDATSALALITGDLLADEPYVAWAIEEREKFATLVADVCITGARQANRERRGDLALRLARVAVEQKFACEAALQELVRAQWRTGRRTEALQTYAELRTTLLEEFGLEPTPATRRLYLAVLRSGSGTGPLDADRLEIQILLHLLSQVLESTGASRDPAARRLLMASRDLSARSAPSVVPALAS